MKRIQDLLAPVGLVVAVGALLWTRTGRTLPGEVSWWVLAGLALVLVHLVLLWDVVADSIGLRQLKHGGNAFVLTLSVVGILSAVNVFVHRNNQQWDLTENRRNSLSDQTEKVVRGLSEDVTITYFGRPENLAQGRVRLEQYQALSRRLNVVYVDPLADPVQARSYEAQPPWPQVFVERGGVRERITNDSEQDLTNALIKVFRSEAKVVCFVQGEGERDLDDRGELGYSAAKSALETSQYEVRGVPLLHEGAVPADCAVTVVAGPRNDLLAPAVDALRAYVASGGSLLVLLEPPFDASQPNVDGLLAEWGLQAGPNVVIDVSGVGQLFGASELMPIALEYPYHEITKDLGGLMTAFATARSVSVADDTAEGVVAQRLVETTPQAWAETDLALNEPVPDEGVDLMGPVPLAALATIQIGTADAASEEDPTDDALASDGDDAGDDGEPEPEPTPDPREGRVVAYGDADFVANQFLGFQGNQDLFLNTVAWLAEDADMISIRPREPDDQRLFLTQLEQSNLKWLALAIIPGLFVAGGIASWWSRR